MGHVYEPGVPKEQTQADRGQSDAESFRGIGDLVLGALSARQASDEEIGTFAGCWTSLKNGRARDE